MSGKYQVYPEYKDSGVEWLGDIPLDWDVLPLKFITSSKVKDGPHETPEFIDDGVPFFSVDSIQDCKLVFEGSRFISREDHERYSLKCRPRKGDVLLGKAASVGKVAYVETDKEFNVWSPLAVITPKSEGVGRFVFYCFQSQWLQAQCDVNSNANTQKNLSMGDIDNLLFSMPDKQVANHIANFLDHETAKIDTLIEKQQQIIKLLKEKRQAVISHAVTKGLNPDAPMRDSGIEWLGVVPEHWAVSRVKYHCNVKGRIGFRGYTVDDLVDKEDGALVIGASEMNFNGNIVLDNPQYISWEKYYESPEIMLKEGMILFVQRGSTVGKVAVAPDGLGDATINPSLIVLRDLNMSSLFMSYSLMGSLIQNIVKLQTSSTAIPMISQEQVGNYLILVPPRYEQNEIEDYIKQQTKKIDNAISASTKSIDLMRERRTALISAAVTGKIDVRNWAAPEQQTNKEDAA